MNKLLLPKYFRKSLNSVRLRVLKINTGYNKELKKTQQKGISKKVKLNSVLYDS